MIVYTKFQKYSELNIFFIKVFEIKVIKTFLKTNDKEKILQATILFLILTYKKYFFI
jgi:hypothetical protein